MAGDPINRIAHAEAHGRREVLRGEIRESSTQTIPEVERKLGKSLSLLIGVAGDLLAKGVPPEETPDPKLVEFLPDLAERGLLTERDRMLACAEKAHSLAGGICQMLGAEGGED